MEPLDNFCIVRYKTLNRIIKSYLEYSRREDNPSLSFFSQEGNKFTMTKKEFHDRLLVRGSWGYMTREVDNNPYQIHIWIDVKKASFEEALRLLAHEIGHCQAPFHDVRKEEMKAGLYEKVTLSAYKLVSDMFSKDTKYTADN